MKLFASRLELWHGRAETRTLSLDWLGPNNSEFGSNLLRMGGTKSPDSKRACTVDNTEITLVPFAEQLHALYELCHRGQKKELHSCPFLLLVLKVHSGFDEKCENAAGCIWLAFTRAISTSEGESPGVKAANEFQSPAEADFGIPRRPGVRLCES